VLIARTLNAKVQVGINKRLLTYSFFISVIVIITSLFFLLQNFGSQGSGSGYDGEGTIVDEGNEVDMGVDTTVVETDTTGIVTGASPDSMSIGNPKYTDPGPPPPPPPPIDDIAVLFKPIESFIAGRVAYVIPDTIEFNKVALVEASISPANVDSLLKPVASKPKAKIKSITIGPRMKMTLNEYYPRSTPGFVIKPLRSDEQIVDNKSTTDWRWSVTPITSGDNGLELIASIVIHRDGKDITVFSDYVYVTTPLPTPTAPFANRVAKNVDSHWDKYKWLWSTLLVPLSGWLAKKGAEWYKSRKAKPASQEGIGFKPKAKENAKLTKTPVHH
jgi:hypothetical protein